MTRPTYLPATVAQLTMSGGTSNNNRPQVPRGTMAVLVKRRLEHPLPQGGMAKLQRKTVAEREADRATFEIRPHWPKKVM